MHTFKLRVDLPLPLDSRIVADRESDRLRHSVIPIIGATANLRPYLVGSAVLLDAFGKKVLVTAHHVLEDNADVPLFTFGFDGGSRPFGGEFQVEGEADIAIKRLSDLEVASFSHVPFLGNSDIGMSADDTKRFYAGIAGYPATRAKTKDRKTIDTQNLVIGGIGRSGTGHEITVHFDKKRGGREGKHDTGFPDPYGISGGAIFGLKLDGWVISPDSKGRLVAIATRWEKNLQQIRGTSIALVQQILKSLP